MKLDEIIESDLSENEEQYSNLADAVSQLDSKHRVKAPTRKGLSKVVSEFHLPRANAIKGDVVNVNELTQVLRNKTASHAEISSKVKSVIKKAKTLPKPLEAPVAERIKRTVAYENVKRQLKKWNAVVEKNRIADHLSFPLRQGRVSLQSSQQFLNKFKPTTPLEIEMAKVLGTEVADNDEEENENLEFPLTLEEMMEKKKELAKIRAKLSYQEAKAHRQSKIKSKKYHRILKREKIKQQLKEFEQLQKTNPEAALKKLEELDKSRAQERASLRHKNTGKWARNLAVRAKYNKESRMVLAEQLKLSKDLTAKVKNVESDEEVSDHENPPEQARDIVTTSDNPWALKASSEVSDLVSSCKKYWENKNKEKQAESSAKTSVEVAGEGGGTNGVSDSTEQSSNALSVDTNDSVVEKSKKQGEDEASSHRNKTETKEKKLVRNKRQSLSNGGCKKSEDCVVVVSKGKNKNLGKKLKDNVERKQTPKKDSKNKEVTKKKNKENVETKIHSTSGSWTVLEVKEENQKKRKNVKDIDDLFEDLDEKLASKTSKKLKRLKRKLIKTKRKKREKRAENNSDDDDLAFKNRSSLGPVIDEEMTETTGREPEASNGETRSRKTALNVQIPDNADTSTEIDPKKFIEVKPKKLNTKLPDNLTGDDGDYMDDDEATQQMNIVEAFGDDDVIEEFEEMKKEEEEKTKLDTPNALPGWGSWGGADIKPDERKTKRNMLTAKKLPPRKDKNKSDMIMREKTNEKLVEHMVKDIPHPFKSVGAFESNLRHPLGRDWIPETAHRKFIKKPVETLLGTVIEPMDENELLSLKKKEKSLYRGKQKQKK